MFLNNNFFTVFLARSLTVFLALISIKLSTHFLSPNQFGQLALLISIYMFFGLFLINPVGQYINLHTQKWWNDRSIFRRLNFYTKYILFTSLMGAVVTIFSINENYYYQSIFNGLVVFFIILSGTWNSTYVSMLNFLGFTKLSAMWALVTITLSIFASVLFFYFHPSSLAWFSGQIVGFVVGSYGAKKTLESKLPQLKSNKKAIAINKKSLLNYCLPLGAATIFMWFQLSGYRFIVNHFWGLSNLGYMAIGMQVASQSFGFVESISMQYLWPLLLSKTRKSNKFDLRKYFSDYINLLITVYFIFAGIFIFISPFLLNFLTSKNYSNALIYVVYGVGIELCRALANAFSNGAHITKSTYLLIIPYALGSVVSLVSLFYLGINHRPISSSCNAIFFGMLVMLLTMIFLINKKIEIFWNTKLISVGFFVFAVLVSLLALIPTVHSFSSYFLSLFPLMLLLTFLLNRSYEFRSLSEFKLPSHKEYSKKKKVSL